VKGVLTINVMQNPGMAQQMVNLQHSAAQATTEQREKLATLKADPELKLIFDDIEENGPSKASCMLPKPELCVDLCVRNALSGGCHASICVSNIASAYAIEVEMVFFVMHPG
jgi:hypothetical protein